MSGPKRHHYVSRVYLERFARNHQVVVRRRDGTSFTSNCINVAVESGFYDVSVDGQSAPSKIVEQALADIEGAVKGAFDEIDTTGAPPDLGSDNRAALATYLALQLTRTPEQRERTLFPERLAAYLGDREVTQESVAEFLRDVHLGFDPSDSEVQGAFEFAIAALEHREGLTRELAMSIMLQNVEMIAPVLHDLSWTVEHERKGRFISSDMPLVLWRPPTERDAYEGVGIENVDEIRFPLDPAKQLVLSRKERTPSRRVTPDRAEACNADVAAGCHRFILGHPAEAHRISTLPLARHRPVLRFNTGPLYERGLDGELVYRGDVIHAWVPRR